MIKFGAKRVIIAARTMSELERVKLQSGSPDRVMVYYLDLNKPKEVYIRLSELFKTEHVDILINNGGISMREDFSKMELSACETIMNTNMLSHIAATKAVLPGMKQRKFG